MLAIKMASVPFKYSIIDDGSLGSHNANPVSFTIVGVDFSDFRRSTGNGESVFFTIDIFGTNAKTGLVGSTNLVVERAMRERFLRQYNPDTWSCLAVRYGACGWCRLWPLAQEAEASRLINFPARIPKR